MKTPCEIIVWKIIPVIRKEFAKSLIKDHGLTQRKAAEMLGLTEATVSRYITGKRGTKEIQDEDILEKIKESANHIFKENGTTIIEETCKICNLLISKEFIEGINYICK